MTPARSAAGFTLIEILVTLAILALAASLVGPGLLATLDAASRKSALIALDEELRLARAQAVRLGEPLEATTQEPLEGQWRIGLPEGWRLSADPPIRFAADGACAGARVTLTRNTSRMEVQLAAPRCRVVGG